MTYFRELLQKKFNENVTFSFYFISLKIFKDFKDFLIYMKIV